MKNKLSVILLCGGKGTRMGTATPKQFLLLKNKIIALYSFEFFSKIGEVEEIIVVCEPSYRYMFRCDKYLSFALPGPRRQDSLLNGFNKLKKKKNFICIHDGARPFIKREELLSTLIEAEQYGAAALGAKAKNTIKRCEKNFVVETLDRANLLEIYTPQIISGPLLKKGLFHAKKSKIEVTDDLSLIEPLGHKVKIVESSEANLKITTPQDLKLAEALLDL